jgi:hypothetical protein
MGKIPGVNHLAAIRALEKAGFSIIRQGKHIIMSDGVRILSIPRLARRPRTPDPCVVGPLDQHRGSGMAFLRLPCDPCASGAANPRLGP